MIFRFAKFSLLPARGPGRQECLLEFQGVGYRVSPEFNYRIRMTFYETPDICYDIIDLPDNNLTEITESLKRRDEKLFLVFLSKMGQ
jgi:hypothetical protein